ncbi:glutamate racemase [Timonella senegalensis]|uniref:glutamate racemase n=1 Tax=Timonella senegalensis TaxID=1465825 RepID=UPI00058CD263|nr:glutamate racemase [Timonella senegalensis]
MNNSPIGIFDSGVGGLTVARSILDQLPNESISYIGDTAHTPYGTKPLATVRSYALEIMDELVDEGVKMLVIACNTASAAVLRDARERYTVNRGIPVVEVILPAARRAVSATRTGKIGVIGTKATVDSRAYDDVLSVATDVDVISVACPDFVPLVEAGITTGPRVLEAAHRYLEPVKAAGVDTLILGCTHYPLLAGAISYVMGEDVTLVSSSDESAKSTFRTLLEHGLERAEDAPGPVHRFRSTGDSATFAGLARRFLGPEVSQVESMS